MTIFISDSVVAPKSAPMLMPLADLDFWCYPDSDPALTARDYAHPGVPMTVVGSPVYGERHARFKSVVTPAYVNTGVAQGDAWTLLVAGAPAAESDLGVNAENPGGLLSNLDGTGSNYSGIGIGWGLGSLRFSYATNNAERTFGGSISPSGADRYLPRFIVFRGTYGGTMQAGDMTTGLHVSAAAAGGTPSPGAANLRIGSVVSATNRYGYSRVYFAAALSRVISDDELNRIYRQVKRSLAADGVIV